MGAPKWTALPEGDVAGVAAEEGLGVGVANARVARSSGGAELQAARKMTQERGSRPRFIVAIA
jgi:hypothetical protein